MQRTARAHPCAQLQAALQLGRAPQARGMRAGWTWALAQLTVLASVATAEAADVCAPNAYTQCKSRARPLRTLTANTHELCCSACKAESGCKAWSWTRPHQCELLQDCSSSISTLDAISGCDCKLPAGPWAPGQPAVQALPFRDNTKPIEERVRWLVGNLSTSEKLGLLSTRTSAIPRLAIRSYMYYVECNSGAYANGHYPSAVRGRTCSTQNLTAFPQSPGMAASFNTTLERMKGDVIGRELRAIALAELEDFDQGPGLSCFSPMINIIRDPMWGRNSEVCPPQTWQTAKKLSAPPATASSHWQTSGHRSRVWRAPPAGPV